MFKKIVIAAAVLGATLVSAQAEAPNAGPNVSASQNASVGDTAAPGDDRSGSVDDRGEGSVASAGQSGNEVPGGGPSSQARNTQVAKLQEGNASCRAVAHRSADNKENC